MFSNIFFLILVLLLTVAGSETSAPPLFQNPESAFPGACLLYSGILMQIYFQTYWFKKFSRRHKDRLLIMTNLELVAFLLCLYFIFGAQRVFENLSGPFSGTLSIIFALLLYFGGIATFHYAHERYDWDRQHAISKTGHQLCFLIPFAVPFLIYRILSDLAAFLLLNSLRQLLGISENSDAESAIIFLCSLLFMLVMIVFLPRLIVIAWRCRDLKDSLLRERLEALSKKAHFKHAGFKIWTIMQSSMTAAIVGVASPFRYVMFTQKLLKRLTPEAIEAILAHEIGHCKRKHLLIYPIILFGMLLTGACFSIFFYAPVLQYFSSHVFNEGVVGLMVYFTLMAIIIGLYFRIVFGYFSRIFERQADLHVFEVDLPAEHMIEALNEIAIASGGNEDAPSWHHYSIRQRIDFLKKAQHDPLAIRRHHLKVTYSLIAYFLFFAIALSLLWLA